MIMLPDDQIQDVWNRSPGARPETPSFAPPAAAASDPRMPAWDASGPAEAPPSHEPALAPSPALAPPAPGVGPEAGAVEQPPAPTAAWAEGGAPAPYPAEAPLPEDAGPTVDSTAHPLPPAPDHGVPSPAPIGFEPAPDQAPAAGSLPAIQIDDPIEEPISRDPLPIPPLSDTWVPSSASVGPDDPTPAFGMVGLGVQDDGDAAAPSVGTGASPPPRTASSTRGMGPDQFGALPPPLAVVPLPIAPARAPAVARAPAPLPSLSDLDAAPASMSEAPPPPRRAGTDPELLELSDIIDGVPLDEVADEFHSLEPVEIVSDEQHPPPRASSVPAQDPLDFAAQAAQQDIQRSEGRASSGAWDVGPSTTIPVEINAANDPADAILDTVTVVDARKTDTPEEVLAAARKRFDLDDLDGALDLLAQIPDRPELSANAVVRESRKLKQQIEDRLQKVYEAKVGRFERCPAILVSEEQLIWMNMNHRVGYILSQIDGNVSYEDLVSLSGMPRIDTLRILVKLIDDGVIGQPAAV